MCNYIKLQFSQNRLITEGRAQSIINLYNGQKNQRLHHKETIRTNTKNESTLNKLCLR